VAHVSEAAAAGTLASFITAGVPPPEARERARSAVLDTIGVTLAGVPEPASAIVRDLAAAEGGDGCRVLGTRQRAGAAAASLANGTAAHALDFDDMCFVTLAHPSAPLVAALLAAGERIGASGASMLDAYVIGFEVAARLGRALNPRHYQRGWHCTSTLGAVGAAAAASRVLGLPADAAVHALAIAASSAAGLKENFGTMVKPLHAGLAARSAVTAAFLARGGMTASPRALDGPQGMLHAMDGEQPGFGGLCEDLGRRWEIVETGITVKLYPSCAGTHPALDAILDLRRTERFTGNDVERLDVSVDSITPTILIHDRPATGLEGKFSMPFCAATAIVHGGVGVASFDDEHIGDRRVRDLMSRIAMKVDSALDGVGPALTQARVTIHLRDGRTLSKHADGARGYPTRPARREELDAKFLSCARRVLPDDAAARALDQLHSLDRLSDIRVLTDALVPSD
jgi:2-methylcitrate dehydratase PrpD